MKHDKRQEEWKKQRKKYGGYDERVGWNLNTWILEALYTWLKLYLKYGGKRVDLSFHKFKINDKTLTEEECIRRILKDLRYCLKHLESYEHETIKKCNKHRKDAFMVLAEVFPALWW